MWGRRARRGAIRVRRWATVELDQVGIEVARPDARLADHLGEPGGLRLEDLDLVVDARPGVQEEGSSLVRIAGLPVALAIALASGVVLEELADLGQGETRRHHAGSG